MSKKYFGKTRVEILEWLHDRWLPEGESVCFLQGFPGVGKSDLARDFRELAEKRGGWEQVIFDEVADRPTPSVFESMMELSIVLKQQGVLGMEEVLTRSGPGDLKGSPSGNATFREQLEGMVGVPNVANLGYAFEKALQRPIVVILDEAQRFFEADSGTPLPELSAVLSHLRYRPRLKGKLLLLSDRLVEEARWSEWIPKRTLPELEIDEAVEMLETRAKETEINLEITSERKRDVVRSLYFNPRAIESLIGALRSSTLDEIIESSPGLWEVRDRNIDRSFIRALERGLLDRTMQHLDLGYQKRLWRLSVHRRSFKREALVRLCGNKEEADKLRNILVSRFLVNFHKGALTINPIVREISLSHLREESSEYKLAHSGAADYHLRHFVAKQIVVSQSNLTESFSELRYHLVQSNREGELLAVSQRFTDFLREGITQNSPVPSAWEELDERISALSVLLEDYGAKGLEVHLARCLRVRGRPGDTEKALVHVERAIGPAAPVSTWYLYAEIKATLEGTEAGFNVIQRALQELEGQETTAPLYRLGAELKVKAKQTGEATAFLRSGIKSIPPDKSLASLYVLCAAILEKSQKVEEAIGLLISGMKVIPPEKDAHQLYFACATALSNTGRKDDAIALLKRGIKVIPIGKGRDVLYRPLANMLALEGHLEDAVRLLEDGIKESPHGQTTLYLTRAEILSQVGKFEDALSGLKEAIDLIDSKEQRTLLHPAYARLLSEHGKTPAAIETLKEAIRDVPSGVEAVVLYVLLSDLLCKEGRPADAAAYAIDGFRKIPRRRQSRVLGLNAMLLSAGLRDQERLAAICAIPDIDPDLRVFGRVLQYQVQGRWQDALRALVAYRKEVPRTASDILPQAEAICHLALGNMHEACTLLDSLAYSASESGAPNAWLCSFIRLVSLEKDSARKALATYLGRTVTDDEFTREYLLQLWDERLTDIAPSKLSLRFPVLPELMTGLDEVITRVPYSKPVLLGYSATQPDVYVSYAWGEDTSKSGREREELVNRLCDVIRASGRKIGRDKDRQKAGDSIERFAQEISKARLIIAIISEKYLHSDFCIAQELFRAYRRCDYQRAEFQEKVVALVLDDAKPLLKDDGAVIELSKYWKNKHEKRIQGLQFVDPAGKSHDQWAFYDLIGEMIPRIPNMLGALNDIVMKRGFEQIVKDDFRDVLKRLR